MATENPPILQIALDYTSLEPAVRIASIASRFKHTIIEAGTPLIKAEGARSISILSASSQGKPVVADTKTMDAADLEVDTMARYGAEEVTVLSAAADETIKMAVEEAHKRGLIVSIDTISSKNPLEEAVRAARLGADIVELHVGVDVQRRLGVTIQQLLDLVPRVKKETGRIVAVAGGIRPDTARIAAEKGADIIIVGGYITRSENPEEAIKTILEAIRG
ncbi:MAG: hypothetical protein GXO09_03240 [Crenarchaeota archaeon]|nr:hypothetical protein [Thermoproteota archaeon]